MMKHIALMLQVLTFYVSYQPYMQRVCHDKVYRYSPVEIKGVGKLKWKEINTNSWFCKFVSFEWYTRAN